MMVYSIITLITIIILLFILYRLLKSIYKAIIILSIILTIVSLIILILTYKDINNIRENIENPIMVFLEDNEIITGLILEKNRTTFLSQEEIDNYKNKNQEERLGSNFRVITITMEFIEGIPHERIYIKDFNLEIKKEELVNTLNSKTPTDYFLTKAINLPEEAVGLTKKDILRDKKGEAQFKASLLLSIMNQLIEDKETEYIIKSYKKHKIKIYKETITFKISKFIPNILLIKALEGNIRAQKTL